MAGARSRNAFIEERQPLLFQPRELNDTGRKRTSCWEAVRRLLPRFDVVSSRYRFVPLLGCLIILFNESQSMFKQVAYLRAIETLHCIEYYEKHDPGLAELGRHIPEKFCKIDDIQKHVATTSALQIIIRLLCSLIGNLPLGWVADTYGRKVVLSLHKINMMFSGALFILFYLLYPRTPIWTLYLTGIPGLIGGNFDLGLAMLFVSYADVMISDTQRTTLFFLTTSMQYPAQAIGPILSGFFMDLDGQGTTPEIAMWVGLACGTISAVLTIFFFPETKNESQTAHAIKTVHKKPTDEHIENASQENVSLLQKLHKKIHTQWHSSPGNAGGIGVATMLLLNLSVLTASIGMKSINWFGLVQYPVIKFHWKFSQATVAVSVQAVIIIINYAVLLPTYTRLGTQFLSWSPSHTSLMVMLLSTLLLILGSVAIGFSTTESLFYLGLLVYTLGGGLSVATQVYISSLIHKAKLARTLASLSVATVGGKVLASALFPTVFAAGLDDERDWMKGLPMFVAAGLFAAAGLAIIVVAITTGEGSTEHSCEASEASS